MTAKKILTPEEKEIRAAEREAMAEVRRWKIKAQKQTEGMTPKELKAFYAGVREEWIQRGLPREMFGSAGAAL